MTKSKSKRIGVLAGGPSNEREISLRSGQAVFKALTEEGFDAIFLDVYDDICDIIKKNKIDIAFIALHGRFGEDGTVQRALERRGIPYTGSGVEASKLALDKIASKEAFIKAGIPVPGYVAIERSSSLRGAKRRSNPKNEIASPSARNDGCCVYKKGLEQLKLPVVVKPQFEGSSIGLSVVRDKEGIDKALKTAFAYGDKALIEECINGRELTVGILEDRPLPVIEIVTRNSVYDYDAKYKDPETNYLVPAPIEKGAYKEAQSLGIKAHRVLGCRSFSRVDMMMDTLGKIFVLEVNTIPGMTERSLLPKAAAEEGLNFNRLCVKLIEGVR